MFSDAMASIPRPPPDTARWGAEAGGPDAPHADLSLAIIEPRKHEWMRAVLWNACHVWGGSGAALYIFHGNLNKEFVEDILEEAGITGVILKPLGADNLYACIDTYNVR